MKTILITGMNTLQTKRDHYLKQQLQVVPSHTSLIACLEHMGWRVEQRPVSLGEDISHYDEVIVYIHSPAGFCQRLWHGLYAIAVRPNCIISFDDWQFDSIFNNIIKYGEVLTEKNYDSAFRDYLVDMNDGNETKEELQKYIPHYLEAIDTLKQRNNRLLISAFDGGDLSRLNLEWNEDKIYRFNPNPYHVNRKPDNNFYREGDLVFPNEKRKEWNFASLVQGKTRKWLSKQNPDEWKWPIHYYGAARGQFKSPRLKEGDMCAEFLSQWGILMPGYFHTDGKKTASGWWRARYLQVADVRSILIGEPSELFVIYNNMDVASVKASDVENMTDKELRAFALMQRECIYDTHPLDKKIQRDEINRILSN
jgi:hypothetical protein